MKTLIFITWGFLWAFRFRLPYAPFGGARQGISTKSVRASRGSGVHPREMINYVTGYWLLVTGFKGSETLKNP